MDIYLSINNRAEVIKLPVVPEEFTIQSPFNNDTLNTIKQGDIKLIGLRGLKTLSFQSFFPSKNYSFLRDKTYKGWQYVEKIEAWRDKRIPVRLIITDTPINMLITIDSFDYGVKTGKDIYYTLSLSEFKPISLNTKGV